MRFYENYAYTLLTIHTIAIVLCRNFRTVPFILRKNKKTGMETQLLQNVVLLAVDVSVCFVLCCFFFYFHLLVWCTLPLQHTLCLGKTCLTCGLVHLKGDKQKVTSIQYIFLPQGGNVAKLLFFPSPVCFLPSLRRDGISVRTAGLQPQLLRGSSVCPLAFVNVSTIQQPTLSHRHQRGRVNAATLGTILQ